MRIGEVAAKAGVSVRALRYYEEHDLLHSSRTPAGHRQFADGAVERVELIQQLYSAGLTSRTIRKVLPLADSGGTSPQLLELLSSELGRLDQQMTDLRSKRRRLRDCIAEAHQQA